jgi:hypothetical protein
MTVAGTYQNVPLGFVHAFERAGWVKLPHVYDGTHHADNGAMLKWMGDGEPSFPNGWKQVSKTEVFEAVVAVITGDKPDDRSITLGVGDGTFQRWKLTDSLLKKLRREINERLD